MDEVDLAGWRAVDHGERELDWSVWLGQPDRANYLTAAGRELIPRMASDLTAFFGPGWLHRALQPDAKTGRRPIPNLGRFAPTLAHTDALRPGAFVEAVRWWAGLQLLESKQIPGLRVVRNDIRNDVTADRLLHTLTQTRLGAIGICLGAEVTLEPSKAGGPGDVLLDAHGAEIFIEVVTFSPDRHFTQQEQHTNHHKIYLRALEDRLSIHLEGKVPGFLPKTEEERWRRDVEHAAAQCAQTGDTIEMPAIEGDKLVVRPGPAPSGTTLVGPLMESDQSHRLINKIRNKAAKTRGAGLAWIWVEDHGGLHPTNEFFRRTLAEQLDAVRGITQEVFNDYRHVAGIIYSYAHERRAPLPPDEQVDGYAFQRGIPIDRIRRTFITNRRIILPTPTSFLSRMCDEESRWPDRALDRLGVTGGVRALVAPPAQPMASRSRLWTPS